MRKATPDSEALASSEDERPWPSSSFGSLPRRRESAVPGLGGIWAAQSRPDFVPSQRLSARASTVRSVATPSPAASDNSAAALPFSIPLQPTAKAGRSLSHSQGQRDPADLQNTLQQQAPALPLGLLAEEVDTDPDSDSGDGDGERLTQTTSHPPIGALQRMSTYPAPYHDLSFSNGRNGGYEAHDGAGDRYNNSGAGGLYGKSPHALSAHLFYTVDRCAQTNANLDPFLASRTPYRRKYRNFPCTLVIPSCHCQYLLTHARSPYPPDALAELPWVGRYANYQRVPPSFFS